MADPSAAIVVRRLQAVDAADYREIRLACLRDEPAAFGSTHEAESAMSESVHSDRLAASIVLGGFWDCRIVGMIGMKRHEGTRRAHKGFVWGFYVEPASRRFGIGEALLGALIEVAAPVVEQLILTVVESQTNAIALYERHGFIRYGLEPRSLKTATGYLNQVLMIKFPLL